MTNLTVAAGWGKPGASKKWHYFDNDEISICRKWWALLVDLDNTNDDSPDNCAECKRRKAKLDAANQAQKPTNSGLITEENSNG